MSVTLTQVTDPLCTWCWGAEPVLRRIEETYGDQVDVEFVMGGLVADFESFCDAANGITEPEHVAPHWEEAAANHGMPVDTELWRANPPLTTYPASEAFHAARFQGTDAAARYLRRVREAAATERRNVAERSELVSLAADVDLDVDEFETALDDGSAREAFDDDRAYARRNAATVFPTFHVEGPSDSEWLRGYQSFERLASAVRTADPSIVHSQPRPLVEFVEAHDRVATREVAEVYGLDDDEARDRLCDLEAAGTVRAYDRGTDYLWEAATSRGDA